MNYYKWLGENFYKVRKTKFRGKIFPLHFTCITLIFKPAMFVSIIAAVLLSKSGFIVLSVV